MADQDLSRWQRILDYIGLSSGPRQYDSEHDYPGHICGIDCLVEPKVAWYNDPKRLTRYTMYFLFFGMSWLAPKALSYVVPLEWQTRPTRLVLPTLLTLFIWLGARRLAKRIADHSQNEANRLLFVAKGAKFATYLLFGSAVAYYPVFWLIETIQGWFGGH